ncbi:hypothetical protein scyTo_0009017 [Scyliorhinus torazame]|uniref:Dipeptidase n=1 Tax=Scyliorhinus torazame TaxID=75743 RepID=A0A401PG48_SCYTO|nr:hypothetical protein [Scyliorhinus torazame]
MRVFLFLLCVYIPCSADQYRQRAEKLMKETPLIDGHNDLAWQLLLRYNNQLSKVDLNKLNGTHTNIPKLKAGLIGGQFWSAYTPCDTQYKDSVRQTLEQIDVIHRMCQKYPGTFQCVGSSREIIESFRKGKVASLIGVEGGHSIDSNMATLRLFYQLGVRYITLTHSCNTPWADNWLVDKGVDPVESNGLSEYGKKNTFHCTSVHVTINKSNPIHTLQIWVVVPMDSPSIKMNGQKAMRKRYPKFMTSTPGSQVSKSEYSFAK